MDLVFNSKEELYERVKPALHAKLEEVKRLNYKDITEVDIWNYLSRIKWAGAKSLTLSDIVSDIMHLDVKKIKKRLEV